MHAFVLAHARYSRRRSIIQGLVAFWLFFYLTSTAQAVTVMVQPPVLLIHSLPIHFFLRSRRPEAHCRPTCAPPISMTGGPRCKRQPPTLHFSSRLPSPSAQGADGGGFRCLLPQRRSGPRDRISVQEAVTRLRRMVSRWSVVPLGRSPRARMG